MSIASFRTWKVVVLAALCLTTVAYAQEVTAPAVAEPAAAPAPDLVAPAPVAPVAAVTRKPTFSFGGEYRPRVEVRNGPETIYLGKDPLTNVNFSHRARLKAAGEWNGFGVTLSPQDVRQWGAESSTTALTSPVMEMHEAYAQYATTSVLVRVGRQELPFDDDRVMGAGNWTQQGRVFDAVRAGWRADGGVGDMDIFGAIMGVKTKPLTPVLNPATDFFLLGVHARYAPIKEVNLTAIGLLEKGMRTGFDRFTVGWRAVARKEVMVADAATYFQMGSIEQVPGTSQKLKSWMAALRMGYDDPKSFGLVAGGDILSGDDDGKDNITRSFDTLYGTAHKWYGTMDYFTSFSPDSKKNHTAGFGLVDGLVNLKYAGVDKLKLQLDQHVFATERSTAAGNSLLGAETDLTVEYGINQYVRISGGYSIFVFGDAMVDIGRVRTTDDLGHWSWLMTSFQL